MKLGCCVSVILKTTSEITDENIVILKDLGYDYAELNLTQVSGISDGDFRRRISEFLCQRKTRKPDVAHL